MQHFSLYPENKKTTEVTFPSPVNSQSEIKAGMSSTQVADIITNRLLEIVEKSLEKSKQEVLNS